MLKKQKEENRKQYAMFTPIKILDAQREACTEELKKRCEQHSIAIGKAEGLAEGKVETARLLKLLGDPIEKIVKITGLSEFY